MGTAVHGGGHVTEQEVRGRTRCFRALGHDFDVETDDAALCRYLDDVFATFAAEGTARSRYRIVEVGVGVGQRHELWFNGQKVTWSREPSRTVAALFWHVNRQVVARSRHLVRLHAAASCLGDAAVVMPAPTDSGKTTLVAGLVRAGLNYLTDEVTAVHPKTLAIHAYPKALSLDRGSWKVLADLEPTVDEEVGRYLPLQWQIIPSAIRPTAITRMAQPRLIVAPRYERGAPTSLEPLSRADALMTLLENTYDFRANYERELEVLRRLVTLAPAYRLVWGHHEEACEAVIDLLAGQPAN